MISYIKLSDFFKTDPSPFILGAFASRIMTCKIGNNDFFYTYTSFRISKFVHHSCFSFETYVKELQKKLNDLSHFDNWVIDKINETQIELRFYIFNNFKITKSMFYSTIMSKISSSEWAIGNDDEPRKECLRGFMELRGSIDTTAKLISQDYFFDDKRQLKKALLLVETLDVPISYANFNARNLQPQYISGENQRNAQFRINLFYYANQIGFLNKYKARIFEVAYNQHSKFEKNGNIYFNVDLPKTNDNVNFVKYLNFFTNNIYEQKLNSQLIKELRKRLNLKTDAGNDSKTIRNKAIIDFFDKISEDKCAVCGTTKTYYSAVKGKQYFEIHHVIPLYNDNSLDQIANLVKLCPNCHRMLKKGSGTREDQINAITHILKTHPEIYEFASSYLEIDDIEILSIKIQSMLG